MASQRRNSVPRRNSVASRNSIAELLHNTKISDIIGEQKQVYTVTTETSVEEAVALITDKKIKSLPVLDKKTNRPVGLVDVVDIAQYITACAPNKDAISAADLDLNTLKIAGRAISLVPIKNVLRTARKSVLISLYVSSPLLEAVELFAQGIHRAIVFNNEKEVAKVLSQTDVLRFLAQNIHMGNCKIIGQRSLAELGYGECEIFSIPETTTVWSALHKIAITGVSALAVVDNDGKLIGNFSASDLRALYRDDFPHLASSVKDFLTKYSAASLNPITGDATKSLIDNVKLLVENRLHHLWLIDADHKPVGIFSLSDLCSVAIHASD